MSPGKVGTTTRTTRRAASGSTRKPRPAVTRSFCTTREAADMLDVSVRTAQLWANSGLLEAWKTKGGHRRISRDSVERLIARTHPAASADRPVHRERQHAARTPRVLVVEDETDLLRLYEAHIGRWNGKPAVRTASDGYEGLLAIGLETPDLLILDLAMPRIDGFRLLRTLRAMPELRSMPIIIVSGLSADEIRATGDIPADVPVLPKPIPFARLRDLGEAMIAAHREAADAERLAG